MLRLLQESLESLERQNADHSRPISRALGGWLHEPRQPSGPPVEASISGGAHIGYQEVAALGFLADRDPRGREALSEGLAWMRGRSFFGSRPLGFEADGLAILGVSLGVATLISAGQAEDSRDWLDALCQRSLELAGSDEWTASLIRGARLVIGTSGAGTAQQIAPELALVLQAKGLIGTEVDLLGAAQDALLEWGTRDLPPDRIAFQRAALRWLLHRDALALGKNGSVGELVAVLERVPHSFRRWPWEAKGRTPKSSAQRWDIQNEYHVQSVLWSLLAPLFPDLEDEEWLASLGHKHPRADLAIPSLRVVLEVKFVRRGRHTDFAGIIEQVAADSALYLQDRKRFSEIVVYVWDDSRHTEQHQELRQGLLKIPGVREAVVIPRPGVLG